MQNVFINATIDDGGKVKFSLIGDSMANIEKVGQHIMGADRDYIDVSAGRAECDTAYIDIDRALQVFWKWCDKYNISNPPTENKAEYKPLQGAVDVVQDYFAIALISSNQRGQNCNIVGGHGGNIMDILQIMADTKTNVKRVPEGQEYRYIERAMSRLSNGGLQTNQRADSKTTQPPEVKQQGRKKTGIEVIDMLE